MAVNLQEKAEIVFQKEKEAKERQQALNMTGRRTSLASPGRFTRVVREIMEEEIIPRSLSFFFFFF